MIYYVSNFGNSGYHFMEPETGLWSDWLYPGHTGAIRLSSKERPRTIEKFILAKTEHNQKYVPLGGTMEEVRQNHPEYFL